MGRAPVDPAALLIAVVAVGLQPVTEEGPWEPINTAVSTLALGLVLCYLWPERPSHWRHVLGFCLGVFFILGVALAWPAQLIINSADNALYWSLAAAAILVTSTAATVARRRQNQAPATTTNEPTPAKEPA